jgi:diadenosine tetraphosphate (Ap4A) HIT family hydrolase
MIFPMSLLKTSVYELPADEVSALWGLVAEVRSGLVTDLKPDEFTIGLNDGVAAGQTVGHAHIHVIPRFGGDVADPRGGIRWVIPDRAAYWEPDS